MALQLLDIDHRYGRRSSLQRVSLTVQPGDCYGFLGHNGAGKTTALRIALGLDRPRRGRAVLDGFDVRRHPREARARCGGMIEATGFYPWVSGQKNLVALARLQGMARQTARREADRWLEEVGLSEHGRRRVGAYSQGMRQRLGLAQALLGGPRYVLLDEPLNGLDPEGVAEFRALIRRVVDDQGVTVLLSSHRLDEVAGLCNRIGVLREGRLLLEQDTASLLAGASHRFDLVVDDVEKARGVLRSLELGTSPSDTAPSDTSPSDMGADAAAQAAALAIPRASGRLTVDLADLRPRDLVRRLVAEGVGVDQLAPRPNTLEEVYLNVTSAVPVEDPSSGPATVASSRPAERLTPSWPVLRMAAYDVRRNGRRLPILVLLALPAYLAWQQIQVLAAGQEENVREVAARTLFSMSQITAFEALGRGLAAAMPVLAVVLTLMASQSVSGDQSLGTLRNVVLRPLRRFQVAVGKGLAVAVALLGSYAVTVAVAWWSAQASFQFGDRFELYHEEEPELLIEALDVEPYLWSAVASPLAPLAAYAALGFLIGVVVNRSMWALVVALVCWAGLEGARVFARPLEYEQWLPSAHLTSFFGDTSFLAFFNDLSIGSAEAYHSYQDTAWSVPALWCGVAFVLAVWWLGRKRVP